jgi:diguanylate cyclase (GGDEF)-like protein
VLAMPNWESISLNKPRLAVSLEDFSPAKFAKAVLETPKKQTIIRLRWLVITVASYLLLFANKPLLPPNFIHVFVLVYVATNLSLYGVDAGSFDSIRFPAILVFADTISLSFALMIAGQLGSDFYLSYFLIIVIASLWKDIRWSLSFAVLLSIFYSSLLFFAESLTTSLLLRIPFVLVASVFYSYFVQLVKNEQALRQKAESEARHDFLTGLPNRQAYQERILEEAERSKRYGRNLSILMVDIDNFKQVNDSFGHDCGDIVLQKVAGHLARNLRNVDFVARIGGEEFVVVLPETDIKGAIEVGGRLRCAVKNNAIETVQGPLSVTVSVGVGSGVLKQVDDHKQMIQDADHALYVAKRSGKDRVETLRIANEISPAASLTDQRI